MQNEPLPALPRQHKTKEADFGLTFRTWWESPACPVTWSASFELKQCEGEALPFSDVKASQVAYATRIASPRGALVRVQGLRGEPDYIGMRAEASYIAISYAGRGFVVVRAAAFVRERDASPRRSLSWERAAAIAEHVVKTRAPPIHRPHQKPRS